MASTHPATMRSRSGRIRWAGPSERGLRRGAPLVHPRRGNWTPEVNVAGEGEGLEVGAMDAEAGVVHACDLGKFCSSNQTLAGVAWHAWHHDQRLPPLRDQGWRGGEWKEGGKGGQQHRGEQGEEWWQRKQQCDQLRRHRRWVGVDCCGRKHSKRSPLWFTVHRYM